VIYNATDENNVPQKLACNCFAHDQNSLNLCIKAISEDKPTRKYAEKITGLSDIVKCACGELGEMAGFKVKCVPDDEESW